MAGIQVVPRMSGLRRRAATESSPVRIRCLAMGTDRGCDAEWRSAAVWRQDAAVACTALDGPGRV